MHATDMPIIDVLLENIKNEAIDRKDAIILLACANINDHELHDEIVARLVAKGIATIEESQSPEIDVEIFRMTLKQNRSTKTFGKNGMNALHYVALHARTTDVIDVVLETGKFDINGGDNEGNTPLHYALMGNYPMINTAHLLQKGANPNGAGRNGITPLQAATGLTEDVRIVELLLNHPDVDVNRLDNAGRNALDYAMNNKKGQGERIANLLIEKGVVDRENQLDAMVNALDGAIRDSDVEMIYTLIENGLNITTVTWNKKNMNALHVASFLAKTTDVIDVVLQMGEFDINGVDDDGLTPQIHHALMGNNPMINVPHLIQLGADPGITEKKGVITFFDSETINEDSKYLLVQLLLDSEAMNVGTCDKHEYYFYPTNVCGLKLNLFLNPPVYKKKND
jgi:ankyrin repeat protein